MECPLKILLLSSVVPFCLVPGIAPVTSHEPWTAAIVQEPLLPQLHYLLPLPLKLTNLIVWEEVLLHQLFLSIGLRWIRTVHNALNWIELSTLPPPFLMLRWVLALCRLPTWVGLHFYEGIKSYVRMVQFWLQALFRFFDFRRKLWSRAGLVSQQVWWLLPLRKCVFVLS